MDYGFIKISRSPVVESLAINKPKAFVLLTLIAFRAKRTGELSFDGLDVGEAKVGDWKNYGMSEKSYRCAKQVLEDSGLVNFRSNNHGTIASMSSNEIYDINIDADTHLGASRGANQGQAKGRARGEPRGEQGASGSSYKSDTCENEEATRGEQGASQGRTEGRAKGEPRATNKNERMKEPPPYNPPPTTRKMTGELGALEKTERERFVDYLETYQEFHGRWPSPHSQGVWVRDLLRMPNGVKLEAIENAIRYQAKAIHDPRKFDDRAKEAKPVEFRREF